MRKPIRMRSWARIAALQAGLLCLAGCGAGSSPAPAPADAGGAAQSASADQVPAPALPAGWRLVAGDARPAIAAASPRLPASAASDDGVQVTVADIDRTIAGGDDVIAVMEALGLADRVYAAPLRSVTVAGRAAPKQFLFNRNTGVEGVLSLEGSFFVGNSLRRHATLAARLRDTGMAAAIVDDLQPAPDKVRKTAALFGLAAQGEALATQVQRQLDEAAAVGRTLARKPRVIHISATGAGGRATVGGQGTAASSIVRLAGGINIGDEASVHDYSVLSNEGVVAADPEIILLTLNDLELLGGEAGVWERYPTLKQTRAGRANEVWVMPDLQLKSSSIEAGTGALALAHALATWLE